MPGIGPFAAGVGDAEPNSLASSYRSSMLSSSSFPFPLLASLPGALVVSGCSSLETDLRRRAVLGVEGSKDPRLRDLSRDGVQGGELGGSERELEEAIKWVPLRREGGEKKREEAEKLSGRN